LPSYGLGSLWGRVEDALRSLTPVYDKVNRVISLGQDVKLRRLAAAKALKGNDLLVLDAGCGPGTMSKIILGSADCVKQIILVDALRGMLKRAKQRLGEDRCAFVQACLRIPTSPKRCFRRFCHRLRTKRCFRSN
jgi:demethylmenaquinone methyltransferase/2-methoxy-6-polyprenyl-1,4-benzoquinol methylase